MNIIPVTIDQRPYRDPAMWQEKFFELVLHQSPHGGSTIVPANDEERGDRPFGLKTWGPPPRPWRALAKSPGARCTPLKQQGGDLFDRRY